MRKQEKKSHKLAAIQDEYLNLIMTTTTWSMTISKRKSNFFSNLLTIELHSFTNKRKKIKKRRISIMLTLALKEKNQFHIYL